MEEAPSPGGGANGGEAGDGSGGGIAGGGGGDVAGGGSGVDELEELWPSRPSTATAMLAQIWVDNPASSHEWTLGIGGVDLDSEVWDVRIHLDGVDNLERTIARDDITYMNLVAMIETQGYSFRDSIYCVKVEGIGLEGMELIENNAKIYELLLQFESKKVLKLHVKRGRPPVAKNVSTLDRDVAGKGSCLMNYEGPVVYDLSPPVVYTVDDDGQVFASQGESAGSTNPSFCANPYVFTQESVNVQKANMIDLEEGSSEELESDGDDEGSDNSSDFDMGEADCDAIEEARKKEEIYVAKKVEEMRKKREDPLLRCEGDSDIEDIFIEKEEPEAVLEPEKKKLPVRRGPTLRCHSSVQIESEPDYKPSSDEDSDPGFLKDSDDDGFEPISMV